MRTPERADDDSSIMMKSILESSFNYNENRVVNNCDNLVNYQCQTRERPVTFSLINTNKFMNNH